MKKGNYSNSPYGKARDRRKEREEREKKTGRGKIPYKYLMSIYA